MCIKNTTNSESAQICIKKIKKIIKTIIYPLKAPLKTIFDLDSVSAERDAV